MNNNLSGNMVYKCSPKPRTPASACSKREKERNTHYKNHYSLSLFAALPNKLSSGRPLLFVPGNEPLLISPSSCVTLRCGYRPSRPWKQSAETGPPSLKYGCSSASCAVIRFVGSYSRRRERRSSPSAPGVPMLDVDE